MDQIPKQLYARCDFKGTVSRDGYFFDSLNILISTFCVCDDGFQCVLKSFSLPYTNIKFLFSSLKLLTNFEKCYTETLLITLLSAIGRQSPKSTPNWLKGKCARINLSKASPKLCYRIKSSFMLVQYAKSPL
jgi:hypothetical protein